MPDLITELRKANSYDLHFISLFHLFFYSMSNIMEVISTTLMGGTFMKRILSILLIFIILSTFPFTGCDKTAQENPDDKTPHTTVEEKNHLPEGTNSETTIVPEETVNNNDTQSTEQTSKNNTTSSDVISEEEIELDRTYFNERFKFEVKYPGIWSIIEQENDPSELSQRVYIYIGNSNVSEIDYRNISKIDHINVYGADVPVSIPESGMTIGEFITDDGIKAKTYFMNIDGMLNTYYVFDETDRRFYYVARVCINEKVNDRYNDVITDIIKSIKLKDK